LMADMKDQVRCDAMSFEGFDSGRQKTWFYQVMWHCGGAAVQDVPEDADLVHWRCYWDCQPCSYPDPTGVMRTILNVSDFYSARQWHSVGMYSDVYRTYGFEHDLMLTLPATPVPVSGPGRTMRLFFFRGPGSDFSERDRAVLTLLRPHLQQAYLNAERRRRSTPQLTRRQWEVLRLAADGHTNAQIAHRLGVSEGTVRIHLQNIYVRLQVS